MERTVDVNSLRTIGEVLEALKHAEHEEARVKHELDACVAGSELLHARLEVIDIVPYVLRERLLKSIAGLQCRFLQPMRSTKLKPVKKELSGLREVIEETCTLAETVSGKVRALDLVKQERVALASSRVDNIVSIRSCVDGVHRAMEARQYEVACEHIAEYRNVDPHVLEKEASDKLRSAHAEVEKVVEEKYERAVEAGDASEILRFCKLFVPLGRADEGRSKYCESLVAQLRHFAEQSHRALRKTAEEQDHRTPVPYIECITKLFEKVASMIREHKDCVDREFGRGSSVLLLRRMQQQCDVHAPKILALFSRNFNIEELARHAQKAMGGARSGGGAAKLEEVELASVLEAISVFSQRCHVFRHFLVKCAEESIGGEKGGEREEREQSRDGKGGQRGEGGGAGEPDTAGERGFSILRVSEIDREVQKAMDMYIMIERYHLSENVRKAIQMDSVEDGQHCSTMVDYVFFVLQKTTRRAFASQSGHAVCAVVNYSNRCIADDLRGEIEKNMSSQRTASATMSLKQRFLIALNNLWTSCEYTLRLQKEIREAMEHVFKDDAETIRMIHMCSQDLGSTNKDMQAMLQTHITQLSTTITPQIRPLLERFHALSYELDELHFAKFEIDDPFAEEFMRMLIEVLNEYKPLLLEANFETLVQIVFRHVAKLLEKYILEKRFTQYGGLQLDKDLRAILSQSVRITQRSIRSDFARLLQMASLLNLENVSEIMDYWGDGGQMTWRLTPTEVRRVLSRRLDFKSEDIVALKL